MSRVMNVLQGTVDLTRSLWSTLTGRPILLAGPKAVEGEPYNLKLAGQILKTGLELRREIELPIDSRRKGSENYIGLRTHTINLLKDRLENPDTILTSGRNPEDVSYLAQELKLSEDDVTQILDFNV